MNMPARASSLLLVFSIAAAALSCAVSDQVIDLSLWRGDAQALHRISQMERLNDAADQRLVEIRLGVRAGTGAHSGVNADPLNVLAPLTAQSAALWQRLGDAAVAQGQHPITAGAISAQRRLWDQFRDEAQLLRNDPALADALRGKGLPRARAFAQAQLDGLSDRHLSLMEDALQRAWQHVALAGCLIVLAGAAMIAGWHWRHSRTTAPAQGKRVGSSHIESRPACAPDHAGSQPGGYQLEQAAAVAKRLQAHVAECCEVLRQRLEALGMAERDASDALRDRPVAQAPHAIQQMAQRLEDALAQSHELTSLALIIATPWTRRFVLPTGATSARCTEPNGITAIRRQALLAAAETSRLAVQVLARLQSSQEQLQRQAAELPRLPWAPPDLPLGADRDALMVKARELAQRIEVEAVRLRPLAQPTETKDEGSTA